MVFDPLKETGQRLAANLVPPGTPSNQRWKYDATVSVLLVVLLTHMAWACGLFIYVGLHGFVTTDVAYAQAQALQNQINTTAQRADSARRSLEINQNQIQLLIVKASLKNTMKDLCNAQRSGNQAALDAANGDIDSLEDQYHTLTGWTFQRPPCDVVLVGPAK